MDNPVCPYPVIPLTLTSPIPECFAFFIARSIANLPMAGPFFFLKRRENHVLDQVIQTTMLSLNYSMTDSLPRMLLPSTRAVDMFSLTMDGSTPCPSDIALFSKHFTYNPRGKEILHFMTLCQKFVESLI